MNGNEDLDVGPVEKDQQVRVNKGNKERNQDVGPGEGDQQGGGGEGSGKEKQYGGVVRRKQASRQDLEDASQTSCHKRPYSEGLSSTSRHEPMCRRHLAPPPHQIETDRVRGKI